MFHSDFFCDIIALFVREAALEGGCLHLASSWQIYNDLCATQPEIIDTLSKPNWQFERSVKKS